MHWMEPIDARERGINAYWVQSAKRLTVFIAVISVVFLAFLAAIDFLTVETALFTLVAVLMTPAVPLYLSRKVNEPLSYWLESDVLRWGRPRATVDIKWKHALAWGEPADGSCDLLLYYRKPGYYDGFRREVFACPIFLPDDSDARNDVLDELKSRVPELADAEPWVRASLGQDSPAQLT